MATYFDRRRALLVGLALLVSPALAFAECAWVLWREEQENFRASGPRRAWDTPLAYPDRAACVAVIAKHVKAWEQERSPRQEVRPGENDTAAEFITWGEDRRGFMLYRLHCLPDTVDPRGPKGGQR